MAKFTFADRYSEAGLEPSSEKILSRQEPVKRIVTNINDSQLIDLVSFYYGFHNVDFEWFRDEFAHEDISFTLRNNEREARILAAIILGELIDDENTKAILAVVTTGIKGKRIPPQAVWLQANAEEAFLRYSVKNRELATIPTKISPPVGTKLATEISELSNDWAGLLVILGKIREESRASATAAAKQVTTALEAFDRQSSIMHEESQMLWWLIGGHSRTFSRSFTSFGPMQAALIGAVDLGLLTTYTQLGPIAIPAMLERVIASSKKVKKQPTNELASAIESFSMEELKMLDIPKELSPNIAPVTCAIDSARTIGVGMWHSLFQTKTGLEATFELSPLTLAEQLYREHLLGKLL